MIHRLYKINGIGVVNCQTNYSDIDCQRRIAKLHCVGLDDIKLIKAFSVSDDIVNKTHADRGQHYDF